MPIVPEIVKPIRGPVKLNLHCSIGWIFPISFIYGKQSRRSRSHPLLLHIAIARLRGDSSRLFCNHWRWHCTPITTWLKIRGICSLERFLKSMARLMWLQKRDATFLTRGRGNGALVRLAWAWKKIAECFAIILLAGRWASLSEDQHFYDAIQTIHSWY